MAWVFLGAAIMSEITATLSLRQSEGFSRIGWSVIVVVGYSVSFFLLSQALQRGMSLAVAYGIWSAIGVTAIAIIGWVAFHEGLSGLQIAGIALVAAGVAALQSGGVAH
ncbi:MAG: multidrug efflux SMR transporter [Solirubrobacteraceae bacterium]|nr:multidrug efflux SMR transporter [Solirubrobacteraceae bacterium]